jgi:hypothetical protein
MGTAADWIEVVSVGVFWSAVRYWMTRPIDPGHRRQLRSIIIEREGGFGLLLGFFMTFGWRILRWPLLLVLLPALAALLILAVGYGRKLRELGLKPVGILGRLKARGAAGVE